MATPKVFSLTVILVGALVCYFSARAIYGPHIREILRETEPIGKTTVIIEVGDRNWRFGDYKSIGFVYVTLLRDDYEFQLHGEEVGEQALRFAVIDWSAAPRKVHIGMCLFDDFRSIGYDIEKKQYLENGLSSQYLSEAVRHKYSLFSSQESLKCDPLCWACSRDGEEAFSAYVRSLHGTQGGVIKTGIQIGSGECAGKAHCRAIGDGIR